MLESHVLDGFPRVPGDLWIVLLSLPPSGPPVSCLAAQVLRMERISDRRELGGLVLETMRRFDRKKYGNIRRIIAGWLRSVVFERHHITGTVQGMDELEGVYTMLAQTVDGWVEKGVQAGLSQGLARGEARMARRMTADALVARFGAAPDEIMARLETISDPEVLRRLAGAAAWQAKSLEDFIALLPDGASH